MATYYADHVSSFQGTSNDKGTGGGFRMEHAKFTVSTALADADQVEMIQLPPNAIVLGGMSGVEISAAGGGTSPTYGVGFKAYTDNADAAVAADIDAFVVTEAVADGAQLFSADAGASLSGGLYGDLNNKTPVTVTWELDGGTTPTLAAGETVDMWISYFIKT